MFALSFDFMPMITARAGPKNLKSVKKAVTGPRCTHCLPSSHKRISGYLLVTPRTCIIFRWYPRIACIILWIVCSMTQRASKKCTSEGSSFKLCKLWNSLRCIFKCLKCEAQVFITRKHFSSSAGHKNNVMNRISCGRKISINADEINLLSFSLRS